MKNKRIFIILAVIVGLLLIPVIAMLFTEDVDWGAADFIIMGSMLLVVGLGIEAVLRYVQKPMHRAAVILAILFGFLLLWAELAVGVFNSPIAGS